jgi:acetylxylan esterase
MCGGGVATGLGPATPPVPVKYQERVVAMIQMGDPRFMPNKSFDVGTAKSEGVSERFVDFLQEISLTLFR